MFDRDLIDKMPGWVEVTNENDQVQIPRQQCSRIVPNEEHRYYMSEKCTHQWEYPLYLWQQEDNSAAYYITISKYNEIELS